MSKNDTVLRFDDVCFEYSATKQIIIDASFSIRRGSKITIMGQNGAGKSTIFKLITGELSPESGEIFLERSTVAIAKQVIAKDELDLTLREFFEKQFNKKVYDIDPKIDEVLEVVNLKGHEKLHDRKLRSFSGGQQARILLASAIIQNPDILLLDEPTNNLDKAGVAHLTEFLVSYQKTVLVISHDAEFLNAFSTGVLYLDVHTHKVEQYVGNYKNVLEDITSRIEKENTLNARLAKQIQAKKDQANAFAMKGGNLRAVAKRMRDLAEELEDEMVDVRKEDKTIKDFTIPAQEEILGDLIEIDKITILNPKNHKLVTRDVKIKLRKNQHLQLVGPNGIGKTTLLETLAAANTEGIRLKDGVRVGYYRQDFSTLDFDDTVIQALTKSMLKSGVKLDIEKLRATASSFLIRGDIIGNKIGTLSEGQKGLVAFAGLVLERPGILILDEPTNHINFRHIPVIAKALSEYKGAMIVVSHVPDFVEKIRIDEILDLSKLI